MTGRTQASPSAAAVPDDYAAPALPAVLPRGRHAAPRHIVEQSQRGRLIEAMAAVVGERGYVKTSVADVIARAGVSRKSFYEHYANKEDCFLDAYETVSDGLIAIIEQALEGEPDPYAAAASATRTYLGWIAAHPAHARAFFIEVLGVGPEALAHRAAVLGRFADLLVASYRRLHEAAPQDFPADVPRHRFAATVGGVNELITERLRTGDLDLDELTSQIVDIQVALLTRI